MKLSLLGNLALCACPAVMGVTAVHTVPAVRHVLHRVTAHHSPHASKPKVDGRTALEKACEVWRRRTDAYNIEHPAPDAAAIDAALGGVGSLAGDLKRLSIADTKVPAPANASRVAWLGGNFAGFGTFGPGPIVPTNPVDPVGPVKPTNPVDPTDGTGTDPDGPGTGPGGPPPVTPTSPTDPITGGGPISPKPPTGPVSPPTDPTPPTDGTTAVPEPSAWMMMIGGFAATGVLLRVSRRRRDAKKFVALAWVADLAFAARATVGFGASAASSATGSVVHGAVRTALLKNAAVCTCSAAAMAMAVTTVPPVRRAVFAATMPAAPAANAKSCPHGTTEERVIPVSAAAPTDLD